MTDVRATRGSVPGRVPTTSFALSVLGLLISAYLTYEHYTGSDSLFCAESSTVNCQTVTTSKWSSLFGLPVSLLGLLFFVAMVVLCLPQVWRRAPRAADLTRLAALAVGVLMVGYLIWAEFMWIGAICLWCTAVHVITFVLAIVVVLGEILREPALEPAQTRSN